MIMYLSLSLMSLFVQELYSLMFSLDWVSIKAQIMGPAHLISDYVEYGHILDKEVSIQVCVCVCKLVFVMYTLL